jgi:hypothetical protein
MTETHSQSSLHKPKAKWSNAEDEILIAVIQKNGPANWNQIAKNLNGRTGKQCRERWISKLSPQYTAEPWTSEEDETLLRIQSECGNRWARVRAALPSRSTIAIKNRWISLKRREVREGTPMRLLSEFPIFAIQDLADHQAEDEVMQFDLDRQFDNGPLIARENPFLFDEFDWSI